MAYPPTDKYPIDGIDHGHEVPGKVGHTDKPPDPSSELAPIGGAHISFDEEPVRGHCGIWE